MWRLLSDWLRAALVALTLVSLWQGIFPYAVQGVLAVTTAFLLALSIGRQAPVATFLAHQGLFLHTGGNVLGWYSAYDGIYDKIAHGVGTFAAVAICHALLPHPPWMTRPWRRGALILTGVAAGTLWEVGEFAVDQLHQQMAGWIEVGRRMQPSLDDTMWDLVIDLATAVVAGLALANDPAPRGGNMKRELLFGSPLHVSEGTFGTLTGLVVSGRQVTHLVTAPDFWDGHLVAIPSHHLTGVGPDGTLYVALSRDQIARLVPARTIDWSMGNQAVSVILIDPALLPHPESEPVEAGALLLNGKFDVTGPDGTLGQVMGVRLDRDQLSHVAIRSGWPLAKEVFVPVEAIDQWQADGLKTHLNAGSLERLSRP